MIKLLFLYLILITEILAAEKLQITFSNEKVKQGSIVEASLELNLEATQKVSLNQIVNQSLGEIFYIQSATPLMRKMGEDSLKSDVKVIVLKIPENHLITHKIGDTSLEINWNSVEFIPTEKQEGFVFGQFTIPSRIKMIQWLIVAFVIMVLVFSGWKLRQKHHSKNEQKKRKLRFKELILSAKEYSDVVSVWQKKMILVKEFPSLEGPFKNLEIVLFKYQFKPYQTEAEKAEVVAAYRLFLTQALEGLNGI